MCWVISCLWRWDGFYSIRRCIKMCFQVQNVSRSAPQKNYEKLQLFHPDMSLKTWSIISFCLLVQFNCLKFWSFQLFFSIFRSLNASSVSSSCRVSSTFVDFLRVYLCYYRRETNFIWCCFYFYCLAVFIYIFVYIIRCSIHLVVIWSVC